MERLDNPAWFALTTEQREFGTVGELAARYRPDVSPLAAIAESTPEAFEELASLCEKNDFCAVITSAPPPDALWRVAGTVALSQWVCPAMPDATPRDVEWIELDGERAQEMFDLAKATDPGPFEMKTHLLGDYIGVVVDDQLVAMAGERMCFDGFREVSAVCTADGHTGRGYAQALVLEIIRRQHAAETVPYLHVRTGSPAEAQAIRAYQNLGFEKRAESEMTVMVRR